MEKLMNLLGRPVLLAGVVFLTFSCNMNPEAVEPVSTTTAGKSANALFAPGIPGLSFPISMNRVDLYTFVSNTATGTVTVRITSADGSVVLGSSTVACSSLLKQDAKNTFFFTPMTLNSGTKYRIDMTRSNPQTSLDQVGWRSSNGSADLYPKGQSYFSNNFPFDMAFATYSDGYLDQQQTSRAYGFAILNNNVVWQEFVPSKIWIVAP
jgi:hypothetical protein